MTMPPGTGLVFASNLGCVGDEENVLQCSSTNPDDTCDTAANAGVVCDGKCPPVSLNQVSLGCLTSPRR